MELKFFGRGAGLADEHTSAYFDNGNEMVLIDCPASTFMKAKQMNLANFERFYVLITHTHGDHVGGLGLFIQYAFFTLKKSVTVVAPSDEVLHDIKTLMEIEGNESGWYQIITTEGIRNKTWFGDVILTKHSPQLEGKCFGYFLKVNETRIIYTGDTSTLQPYLLYLADNSELYVDTSVYYGMIHLKLSDAMDDLISFTKRGIHVYLMHLDDVPAAEKIIAGIPGISVVETI